jgi:hypothetical protein
MKIIYEYITFQLIEEKPSTRVFQCINNKSRTPLGEVKWAISWRQYVYHPTCQAIYSAGCLADIQSFITRIMCKPSIGRKDNGRFTTQ